ncbi:MAG: hypothetical protein ACOYBP_09000 [Microbacteriaceae bacterium]
MVLAADSTATSTSYVDTFTTNTLTAGVKYEYDFFAAGVGVGINGTNHVLEMFATSTTFAVGSYYIYQSADGFQDLKLGSASATLLAINEGWTNGPTRTFQGVFTLTANSTVKIRHKLSTTDTATICKYARFRIKALP